MNAFDCENWSEDEALIVERSFEEWARRVVAKSTVDLEEEQGAVSVRPTLPIFLGEPWR